jgi:hypothetical protein
MSLTHQLNNLEGAGLISLVNNPAEVEFIFRHALIQDAAYNSLLLAERRRLHQAVGQALETLAAGSPEELAGMLAHHFAAAGDRERALTYARQAAQLATSRNAFVEARQYLSGALTMLRSAEPDENYLALLEELADIYQQLQEGGEALILYREALELASAGMGQDSKRPLRLRRHILQLASTLSWSVDVERLDEAQRLAAEARAALDEALPGLAARPPEPETFHILQALAHDAWLSRLPPDWAIAENHAQAALAAAEALGDPAILSAALGVLATVYHARGLLTEQLEVALRREAISGEPGFDNVRERIEALHAAGSALMVAGQYDRALHSLDHAKRLAAGIQAVGQQFSILCLQLLCLLRLDRWDQAQRVERVWRDLEGEYRTEIVGLT